MLVSFIARKLLRTAPIPQHKAQQVVSASPVQMGSQRERPGRQRSSLALRLIRAQDDPAKQRLRGYLLAQTDDRLRESLGLSAEDIRALRRQPVQNGGNLRNVPHSIKPTPERQATSSVTKTGSDSAAVLPAIGDNNEST